MVGTMIYSPGSIGALRCPLSLKAIKDDEESEYANLGIGVRTGRLLMSIRTGLDYRTGSLFGEVGPNTTNYPGYDTTSRGQHYAIFVHEGTRFMRARPFLANAVKSAQPEIDRLFKEAAQNTLDRIALDTNR